MFILRVYFGMQLIQQQVAVGPRAAPCRVAKVRHTAVRHLISQKYIKYLMYFWLMRKMVLTYEGGATMSAVHYDSYTDARAHLKDLLDAAEKGCVATVRRESARTAVVDVERLRHFFALLVPLRAQVVPEAEGWSVFIPGLPIAVDGPHFDESIMEMVDALREYADDWQECLWDAPNHGVQYEMHAGEQAHITSPTT
jgi:hypothetical protein